MVKGKSVKGAIKRKISARPEPTQKSPSNKKVNKRRFNIANAENDEQSSQEVSQTSQKEITNIDGTKRKRKSLKLATEVKSQTKGRTKIGFTEDENRVKMSVDAEEAKEFLSENSSDEEEMPTYSQQNETTQRQEFSDRGESDFEADYEDDVDPDNEANCNQNRSRSFDEGEILEDYDDQPGTSKPRKARKSQEKLPDRGLGAALKKMQQIINKKGYIQADEMNQLTQGLDPKNHIQIPDQFVVKKWKSTVGGGDREITMHNEGRTINRLNGTRMGDDRSSVITIYQQAVRNKINKRGSSSSKEGEIINTSDKIEPMEVEEPYQNNPSNFISAMRRDYDQRQEQFDSPNRRTNDRFEEPRGTYAVSGQVRLDPEDRAEQLIREAEENKMKIYGTPGKAEIDIENQFVHSAMVDETFTIVASHLEESTIEKIGKGEYIDFAKLIPKDRIKVEEETEMKMVIRAGRTFYVPVNDGMSISGFNKWETAFRIFSNIYTKFQPHRASELIQYNHIIHMASLKYIWENVYSYDKDFHLHLSKHPTRSWAIILQQSWSLRLQDRIRYPDFHDKFTGHGHRAKGKGNSNHSEVCCKFNRGKCTYRANCKFDHHCSYCNKFGHPSVNCRKAIADRAERNEKNEWGNTSRNGYSAKDDK